MKTMKIKSCYINDMSYIFTLIGDWMPSSVMEMRIQDELVAIVNVEPWDTEGTLIARSIWLDRESFKGKPPELFVHPYVTVAPLTLHGLELYMAAEGLQGIAHVLHTTEYTYIANRMTYVDRMSSFPWVCYLLDHKGETYSKIYESYSLDEMQVWLCDEEPQKQREIKEWHVGGRKIYNLLDYGVYADGVTDDTDKIIRVINMLERGDILYLPSDRRIRLHSSVVIPKGVVVDIHEDQFVTEGSSS